MKFVYIFFCFIVYLLCYVFFNCYLMFFPPSAFAEVLFWSILIICDLHLKAILSGTAIPGMIVGRRAGGWPERPIPCSGHKPLPRHTCAPDLQLSLECLWSVNWTGLVPAGLTAIYPDSLTLPLQQQEGLVRAFPAPFSLSFHDVSHAPGMCC